MENKTFLLVLFLGMSMAAQAQFTLCGTVRVEGQRQEGAVVYLQEHKDSLITNSKGGYCFSDLPSRIYHLKATYKGEESFLLELFLREDRSQVNLDIWPPAWEESLEAVAIQGKKAVTRRIDHAIKTEVVQLEQQVQSSISVEQLLNRSAGIRVRNSGGLGAQTDMVVGGFSGKSVRYLMDGIPVDYLGSSMGITKIPTNMADYVELYKGVLPTEIGVDALGAAVNIVTHNPDKNNHRASYEFGSFNTHRLSHNSFIRHSGKLSFGVDLFANYSDNDFKADDLPLTDPHTGRTELIRARMFHNAYQQLSTGIYVNFENRTWADLLQIKINSYGLKRDIQNDFSSRNRAYGKVYRKEYAYAVPSLRYKKSFFDHRLNLEQFMVYSQIRNELADPLKNQSYDWLGQSHPSVSGSEIGRDLSNLTRPVIETATDNFTYRGLFIYRFNNRQKLTLNLIDNFYSRRSDNLNEYDTQTHIRYNKLITGLGYEHHFLDNRMTSLTQLKYLNAQTSGSLYSDIPTNTGKNIHNGEWSFSQAFKLQTYNGWLFRVSAENTYRLPDQSEIFGDNVFILPNLELQAEKSVNLNAGFRYEHRIFRVEANTYFRNIRNLIKLKDITQFQANFLNLDHVQGYGVELEGSVSPFRNAEIAGNLTYNEFRFKGSNENIANNEHFRNARVSNTPFYFGNLSGSYQIDRLFSKRDNLKLYWNYTYVHQFYLDFIEKKYEPDGFLGLFGKSKVYTDRIIPKQQVHSAGFVWMLKRPKEQKIALGVEFNNIFNEKIYNNFKMQSAGRNLSAKITYEF